MGTPRISARAIVIDNGRVLLNEFNHGEYYNLPGGGVQPGETLRAAVEREVLEESGLHVVSKELLYVYEYNPERDGYRFGPRPSISHVFRCVVDGTKKRQEPTEPDADPAKGSVQTGSPWISPDELVSLNLVPAINERIIADVTNGDYTTRFLENIHGYGIPIISLALKFQKPHY